MASEASAKRPLRQPILEERHDDLAEGNRVHVAGHGPATVRAVRGGDCDVEYPSGERGAVERGLILVRQDLCPGADSPTGPRRLEYLGRAFDDESRTIRTGSATFSLVATMVGGGVLSLPYAMSQCGLLLGILVLFVSAALSAWTMDMLVECARSTGRDTFELVGHAAFGERCRMLTVLLVFLLTWLAQVAYFVLMQDLLTPTAELVAPALFRAWSEEATRRTIVTVAAVLLAPMCYKSSLSALRLLCFASVGSVVLVACILGFKAAGAGHDHEIAMMNPDKTSRPVELLVGPSLWPTSFSQVIYVLPMFGVSFMCHFNALPTHQELERPTRHRMRRVVVSCVALATAMYLFVGISGYVWAADCTCGNILLNFARDDGLVAVGRCALGLVLMLNFPLLLQPARNAIFRLLVAFGLKPSEPAQVARAAGEEGAAAAVASQSSEGVVLSVEEVSTALAASSSTGASTSASSGGRGRPESSGGTGTARHRSPSPAPGGAQVFAYRREDTRGMMSRRGTAAAVDTFLPKDETVRQSAAEPTRLQRYVLTTCILITAMLTSMFMKSILVVWSVLGSTVAFMIAYIMPLAFWIKLVGHRSPGKRRAAIALLGMFVVLAVACSVLTAMNLSAPPCPLHEAANREHPAMQLSW